MPISLNLEQSVNALLPNTPALDSGFLDDEELAESLALVKAATRGPISDLSAQLLSAAENAARLAVRSLEEDIRHVDSRLQRVRIYHRLRLKYGEVQRRMKEREVVIIPETLDPEDFCPAPAPTFASPVDPDAPQPLPVSPSSSASHFFSGYRISPLQGSVRSLTSFAAAVSALSFVVTFYPLSALLLAVFVGWRSALAFVLICQSLALIDEFLFGRHARFNRFINSASSRVAAAALRSMGVTVIRESPLDPDRNYLFAHSPHGILFFGMLALHVLQPVVLPNHPLAPCGIPFLFKFPVYRQVLLGNSAIPSTKRDMVTALDAGQNVILVPGGMPEMYSAFPAPAPLQLHLRRRTAMVRLAIDTGAPLVPVLCFGETELYHTQLKPLRKLRIWLGKRLRVGLVWPVGLAGLPIPRPRPLTVVVGAPVPIELSAYGNTRLSKDELVTLVHQRYLAQVEEMYARWRDSAGEPPGRQLLIV
jgi:2-acylglycerol O-acyltransferase 2